MRRGRGRGGPSRGSQRPPRPNFFLAVPLSQFDAVKEHVSAVQTAVVQSCPELERACVDPASAHLTLFVLAVDDGEGRGGGPSDAELPSVEAAAACLEASVPLLLQHDLLRPLDVCFKGLGNFGHEVLFLEVEEGQGLTQLQEMSRHLSELFVAQGLLKESPRPFKAHLTVAKTSQLNNRRKGDYRVQRARIPPESYASYREMAVEGTFKVNEVQLCKMQGRAHGDYYTVAASLPLEQSSSL